MYLKEEGKRLFMDNRFGGMVRAATRPCRSGVEVGIIDALKEQRRKPMELLKQPGLGDRSANSVLKGLRKLECSDLVYMDGSGTYRLTGKGAMRAMRDDPDYDPLRNML